MTEPAGYACPHCRAIAEIATLTTAQYLTCEHCREEFEIPAIDVELSSANALDGVRIRQLTAARRATNRIRSYYMIAAVACGVVVIQWMWMTVARIWVAGVTLPVIGEIIIACFAVYGSIFFGSRAVILGRELRHPSLIDPLMAPDVSTLGDGSEQWKRLDEVH